MSTSEEASVLSVLRELGIPLSDQDRSAASRSSGRVSVARLVGGVAVKEQQVDTQAARHNKSKMVGPAFSPALFQPLSVSASSCHRSGRKPRKARGGGDDASSSSDSEQGSRSSDEDSSNSDDDDDDDESSSASDDSSDDDDDAAPHRHKRGYRQNELKKSSFAADSSRRPKRSLVPVAALALNPWAAVPISQTTRKHCPEHSNILRPELWESNPSHPGVLPPATTGVGVSSSNQQQPTATAVIGGDSSSASPQQQQADRDNSAAVATESLSRLTSRAQKVFSVVEDADKFQEVLHLLTAKQQHNSNNLQQMMMMMMQETHQQKEVCRLLEMMGVVVDQRQHGEHQREGDDPKQHATNNKKPADKKTSNLMQELFGDDDDDDDDDARDHDDAGFQKPKLQTKNGPARNQQQSRATTGSNSKKPSSSTRASQAVRDAFAQWSANSNSNNNAVGGSSTGSNSAMSATTATAAADVARGSEVASHDFLERARRNEWEQQQRLQRTDDMQLDRRRRARDDPR